MKFRVFSLFFIVALFSSFNPGYADVTVNTFKSGEQVINNYIKGYQKNDYKKIILCDLHMLKRLSYKVESFPKPFQKEEEIKEKVKIIEELINFEQHKLSKGTSLTTPMRLNQ